MKMKRITINETMMEFCNIIYVDCNIGNDEIGDGSQENPFKSYYKAHELAMNTEKSSAIVLSKGFHELDKNMLLGDDGYFTIRKNIAVLGYGKDTILRITGLFNDRPYSKALMGCMQGKLCNLVFEFESKSNIRSSIFESCRDDFEVHNVWFRQLNNINTTFAYSGITYSTSFIVKNCIFELQGTSLDDTGIGKNYFTNCLWTRQPSKGVKEYNLLRPINSEEVEGVADDCKNQGDPNILNPITHDRSHIGVYGGPLAWGRDLIIEEGPSCDDYRVRLNIQMVNGHLKQYDICNKKYEYFLEAYEKGENIKFDKFNPSELKSYEILINEKIASYEVIEY